MSDLPPVLLLSTLRMHEVQDALDRFIVDHDELSFYEAAAQTEECKLILFHGLQFRINVLNHFDNSIEYRKIFCEIDTDAVHSVTGISLGDNITGGNRVAPIAQAMMQLAAIMTEAVSCVGIAWTAAQLVADPVYFADTVIAYSNGGVFPVLSTVDIKLRGSVAISKGLDWFAGQEIEVNGSGHDDSELLRRAVRIIHDIATNGPVLVPQQIADLDDNHEVSLTLSDDSKIVSAKIAPKMEHLPL
jgi:hypothetical protein